MGWEILQGLVPNLGSKDISGSVPRSCTSSQPCDIGVRLGSHGIASSGFFFFRCFGWNPFSQGYFKVLGKGKLPAVPIIVKAKIFSKLAEQKIRAAGGACLLSA